MGPDACAYRSFISVRLAVPAAAPPARAHWRKLRRETFLAMVVTPCLKLHLLRKSQVTMHNFRLRFQFMRGPRINDGAFLHQKNSRTELKRGLYILLNQQNRHTTLVDTVNLAPDLRDQLRHYSFCRLVEDDQLGPHHQAARDREHLLFAAR